MTPLQFFSDPAKEALNLRKHGIRFSEAETVFLDPLAATVKDDDHLIDELRFITVGMSLRSRVLFVVYTENDSGIRLIGARQATPMEQWQYENQR